MESILLENGSQFKGVLRGYLEKSPVGEAVFNTSMTGYQEILTDPSYAGQIVMMTYPQIGNYGINLDDRESSRIQCQGFIVRELSKIHSNFTSQTSLEDYLIENKIACMTEVDTRAITRVLSKNGAMGCTFLREGESKKTGLERIKAFSYSGVDWSAEIASRESSVDSLSEPTNGKLPKVAILDVGIKQNILNILKGFCSYDIFTPALLQKNINALDNYDGFFLSNGPGDPQAVEGATQLIQKMLATGKPIFGICLGHQLLSLALGANIFKLKFGHHGANHPVKNLKTGLVELSSQNHGFAVDPQSLNAETLPTHINMNDETLAGLELKNKPVYSIQYHPEASPGPHDSKYLFQRFQKDLQSHLHA